MSRLRYSDVFVPGGFPRHTYNPRETQQLETKLRLVADNLCKLVTVTGHTKSGKTVLVRSIFSRENALWIDGGTVGAEEDFWTAVIDQLNLFQTAAASSTAETTAEVSATGKATANFLVVKGEGGLGGKAATSRGAGHTQSRTVPAKVAAIKGLRESKIPLVIDDFHYIPRDLQGEIVRAVKPLIFDGQPIIIIAIPHRRYDAVKVEKEMTARILPIEVPSWSMDELQFIPQIGFAKLHGDSSPDFTSALAKESIGSPHLMQEFCRAICRAHQIDDTFDGRIVDLPLEAMHKVYAETAETIGRPIFEKLARGPRQRSDRISRELKSGDSVDIYGLVLHGLAHLRPNLITLQYEDLRSAIRDVSRGDAPQLHEVARVLKHMSEIAATDQSSSPVIDFDEEEKQLHITDPFFAFYLRWGHLDT